MYLVKTPWLLKKLYPSSLVWHMPRDEKAIYITFDDGPIPGVTPWVLETLKKYEARATFFCIGDNVRKHPAIYGRLLEEGHAAGNHTFNHLNGWKTPDDAYLENIEACAMLVKSGLFRPPYGRISRSQLKKMQQDSVTFAAPRKRQPTGAQHPGGEGTGLPAVASSLRVVMWDVLSGDFDRSLSPEKCLKNVLAHAENGSIVVFHDSLKAEERLRYALPRALEAWKGKNFELKKLVL